jgi:transcription-repair coupling factor (superfamily II helicase)
MSRRAGSSRPHSTGRSKAAIARSKTLRSNATVPPVLGLLAVRLLDWRKSVIHVAASELRAERLAEETSGTVVITAADLLGSRAEREHGVLDREADLLATPALSFGDAVIHLDYGLGMLSGLELLALPNGTSGEAVRLTFKDQASVVVPAVDMDRIWRYAGDAETAPLDRLKGEACPIKC